VIWDVKTGMPVRRFETGTRPHYSTQKLVFSADGRQFAACVGAGQAFVWDRTTGKELKRFEAAGVGPDHNPFLSVAFIANDKQLAVGRYRTVEIYDASKWEPVRSFEGKALFCARESKTLVGLTDPGKVVFTDLETGNATAELDTATQMDGLANGLALSGDGKTAGVYSRAGEVELWSVPGGKRRHALKVPEAERYHTVAFSADGKIVFFGTTTGVHRWDVATGRALSKWERTFDSNFGRLTGLHVLPDGDTLLACAEDGLIRGWSMKAEKELPALDRYARAEADITPDRRRIVIGDFTGRVDVRDAATGELVKRICESGTAVTQVAISPDGKTVAVGRDTGQVELRDVATGNMRHTMQTPGGDSRYKYVRSVFFSPDGRTVYGQNWVGRLQSWDTESGKQGWVRPSGGAHAASPDGKTVVSTGESAELVFRDSGSGDVRTRQKPPTANQHFDDVTAIRFSPDGRQLLIGTRDRLVRICHPTTGAERTNFEAADLPDDPMLARINRRARYVQAFGFSVDGKWLVTGGSDMSVRVWEVETRRELRRFSGHDRPVSFVAFGPGGKTIISAGKDGGVYQWDPRPAIRRSVGAKTWDEIGSSEPAVAYQAIWALTDAPEAAVRTLRAALPSVKPEKPERIAELVQQLDAPRFAAREEAMKALTALGPLARPALKEAAGKNLSAETKERVQKLLAALEGELGPEALRQVRAVQALELAGTVEAKALLKEWAAGAPGAVLTEDAKRALKRLSQ
jgi:WD40 repeat protein